MRGTDQFYVEAGCEGGHLRDGEVVEAGVVVGGEELRELGETKSCDYAHDIRIVAEIEV